MNANNPVLIQVLKVLVYQPEKFRKLIAVSENPGYIYRLAKYLMPYRAGIEIDCTGGTSSWYRYITDKFDDTKFTIGRSGGSLDMGLTQGIEIKLSPHGFNQLSSMKKVLDSMIKDKTIALDNSGGIHVHIDLDIEIGTREYLQNINFEQPLRKQFNYIRNKVFHKKDSKIEYTSGRSYVNTKGIIYGERGDISILREYQTIEYRLGYPTLDYSTITKWILCCQHMNMVLRTNCEFNKELTDRIIEL